MVMALHPLISGGVQARLTVVVVKRAMQKSGRISNQQVGIGARIQVIAEGDKPSALLGGMHCR